MASKNFLVSVLLLSSAACKTPGGEAPEWSGKIWHGNPDRVGIERTQENEFIHASDEQFNNYFCVTDKDLLELYKNMLKCKKWEK